MGFIGNLQLNIMLVLSGICCTIAIYVNIIRVLSRERKKAIVCMEIGAAILLACDRYAYIFRGDVSRLGFWMVRISNLLCFMMIPVILFGFNLYVMDLYLTEGGFKKVPARFRVIEMLIAVSMVLVVISHFTGIYYTFDETNHYIRSRGFALCYAIPFTILIIDFTLLRQMYARLSRLLAISITLFLTLSFIAPIVQVFTYGLSVTNISIAAMTIVLFALALKDMNDRVEQANKMRFELMEEERRNLELVFEQTAEALASAIDAKDTYTHGHSARVAEYSEMIAREAGWDEDTCREVFYAALLHDVGKIGIPNDIINKKGKLSADEYDVVKTHPVIGNQILSSISRSPYLSIGAHYHHERYDGKGYPDHLKGEDIPALARIIALADAYDAMTSKRSYRDPIPQQKVREEIVKGLGTQFDPEFAKIMLRLIDHDIGYEMKEREEVRELSGRTHLACGEYRSNISEGIVITQERTKIRMRVRMSRRYSDDSCIPTLIIFDSLDARVHFSEQKRRELLYYEYGTIGFDGAIECPGSRNVKSSMEWKNGAARSLVNEYRDGIDFEIEAIRVRDHLKFIISCDHFTLDVIIALPDSCRFAYIGLTGRHCDMSEVTIDRDDTPVEEDYIERIAEEISFIDGPAGDIPNVQVNGWKTELSEPIPVKPDMKITFHSVSLPTARLVWHCPYMSIYTSADGSVGADDYREFVLIRFDGENWESDEKASNSITVNMKDDFGSWDTWKKRNKEGIDYEIYVKRRGNRITVNSDNGGISLYTTTDINMDVDNVYLALTGDQVALTNIHIS
ncbi:MAG: HD-GYP domain-containing protein [Lachnospiraceae bacterium]|nr:HD-GYP domain-containing protein [Lachnospiraceae bacterium]